MKQKNKINWKCFLIAPTIKFTMFRLSFDFEEKTIEINSQLIHKLMRQHKQDQKQKGKRETLNHCTHTHSDDESVGNTISRKWHWFLSWNSICKPTCITVWCVVWTHVAHVRFYRRICIDFEKCCWLLSLLDSARERTTYLYAQRKSQLKCYSLNEWKKERRIKNKDEKCEKNK